MGEFLQKERVIKPLLAAGIGIAAYAGYRLMKERAYFRAEIIPIEEATLPEAFQKRLTLTNEKVTELLERSAALKLEELQNELHRSMFRPTAFVFSKKLERFAELAQTGIGSQLMSRSATIFPCAEEDGALKISRRAKSPEGGKGHQIYWGLTPDGIRTEARTFGSDGLEPEQALDRIYDLVHAPDLEVMSLDDTLDRSDLYYRAEVDL